MEMKYMVFILAALLVACSGNEVTGNVVEEESPLLAEIEELKEQLVKTENLIAAKETLVKEAQDAKAVAQTQYADLLDDFEVLQGTVNQQKAVLKQMDNERLEAVNEAEGCDERIEELETANEKLQKMLDICQEDLQ